MGQSKRYTQRTGLVHVEEGLKMFGVQVERGPGNKSDEEWSVKFTGKKKEKG